MNTFNQYVARSMEVLQFIQLSHWTTQYKSKHETYGWLYTELTTMLDSFVEQLISVHGNNINVDLIGFNFSSYNSEDTEHILKEYVDYLESITFDSLILSVARDDMARVVSKGIYLLTLI